MSLLQSTYTVCQKEHYKEGGLSFGLVGWTWCRHDLLSKNVPGVADKTCI